MLSPGVVSVVTIIYNRKYCIPYSIVTYGVWVTGMMVDKGW